MNEEQKEIAEKMQEIKENLTKQKIENATSEELIEYLMEVHEIEALILSAVNKYEKNK